ncbi:GPW/gp25 family protein [Pseudomonas citronellolis]|uniref:GPW/gp25 family protein n=1 Tax=Pseudomonas citronellolis TaxID=53408 RepID=UPI002649C747|nr:GPW/gp25 family protein [Pseudomonas citronellolis]MDN6873818.1 GPW/gp25 family protein [Pseudomonas citronellolis]
MTQRLYFPYRFDGHGRTRDADEAIWIRGLIEQVLFTAPGERVMRPDFGSGLRELVFAPNSPELAATVQFLVQGALQQWLAGLILVEGVEVSAVESRLAVQVQYRIRRSNALHSELFVQGGAP